MSQTETMEKEFTEAELAGGESLVDDEDLTDEEYVEALGDEDENGNNTNVSDKPKKVKSPVLSPVHSNQQPPQLQKKETEIAAALEGSYVKKSEFSVDEGNNADCNDNNNNNDNANNGVMDISTTGVEENGAGDDSVVCDAKEKDEVSSEKENADQIPKDKDIVADNDGSDNTVDKNEVNYDDDIDEEDELEEDEENGEDEEIDREEDEAGRDDGHSIDDAPENADDQDNSDPSKQANKELDDDEDRRNPQYIPKRGAFYEHDDRLGTDEEEEEEKEPEETEASSVEKKPDAPVAEARKPKKLWSDDAKWGHDMFDDEEQRPKPKDEIVSTYGYDIRNEDGPPKARRRRRYGRGPNRYTRSWKDEGAYSIKPNETPIREKVKPENSENIKQREKDSNRCLTNKDTSEKLNDSRRSGSKGQQPQQQRRTELKSVAIEGNYRVDRNDRIDRIDRNYRNDRIDRIDQSDRIDRIDRDYRNDRFDRIDQSDRSDRMDRRKPPPPLKEREVKDYAGYDVRLRDAADRNRDNKRNVSNNNNNNNRSPGPSRDQREFNHIKNERLGGLSGDVRRNQKDFFENDFPELPQKSKDKFTRPQQSHHHQQLLQQSATLVGEISQPNVWNKSRSKHSNVVENIRGIENSLESTRVPETNRPFNLSDNNPKLEIVKTQTFENSRYFNRRPLTKGGAGGSGTHHPEPSNNINKKDLSAHRSNRGRTRATGERDFRNSGEVGRPITKTSHLASDDYDDMVGSASGPTNMEQQQRRNRYNVNKERDYRNSHDDRRGPEVQDSRGGGGRGYLDDRHHYEDQFNENQIDLSSGLNKLTLVDKSNNRLTSSSEVSDSNNLSKPKRYSSLRQHQAQQQQPQPQPQQQQQPEPLSQHQQQLKQPPQQPPPNQQHQPTRDAHQSNSNLTQYPSTSQHLNLNHPRQSTNVQYYEAPTGTNPQPQPPPPLPSASYYIDNRSTQSSFGYIPTTNIEGGPAATRFLSQMAPRFIPPPTAAPPTAPEPRFMAQAVAAAAVAANPAAAAVAAAGGTLPPVIPGPPPAATYLPTYPPGYPQFPPPPPPAAAQFSIAPPPPPPPSAPEMYRGGVTYYDTMTQQVSPRQLPQRRPKNALPIVPPPDLSNNPDGMVANQGYDVDENDLNQNVETITC